MRGLPGLVLVVISIFIIPTGLGRLDGRVYPEWLPLALIHTLLLIGGIALFFFGLFSILRSLRSLGSKIRSTPTGSRDPNEAADKR